MVFKNKSYSDLVVQIQLPLKFKNSLQTQQEFLTLDNHCTVLFKLFK